MDNSDKPLAVRLASLSCADPADYVALRRDLLGEFIDSMNSPESRKKLQVLQQSLDQMRAISGCTSHSLTEMLGLLNNSLQEIIVLSDRLLNETGQKK